MSQQYGFADAGIGFDTGQGQAGFDWSQPESASERETRERKRQHDEAERARRKREREQAQREANERAENARRERQRQQDESKRQREYAGVRSRCQFSWEACHEILGVPVGADAKTIRAAWAAKMRTAHPDAGGDPELAKRFNAAYNQLKRGGR